MVIATDLNLSNMLKSVNLKQYCLEQVKAPAAKLADLSSVQGNYMEGETNSSKLSSDLHTCATACAHAYTYK